MRWCWILVLFLQTGLGAQVTPGGYPSLTGWPSLRASVQDENTSHTVLRIDGRQWLEALRHATPADTLELQLDSLRLLLLLEPAQRIHPSTRITLRTEEGDHSPERGDRGSWSGRVLGPQGGPSRFTITPDHLSGGFIWKGETWLVEPLWYRVPDADRDLIILYRDDPAALLAQMECLALHPPFPPEAEPDQVSGQPDQERAIACKLVDYSAATDWAFFQKYGSSDEVINRLETVMGLVEMQYTGIFNHDYQFPFQEIFISACPTCDPPEWTSSTDAGALLGYFRDWGQSGGFTLGYFDVSSLWTGRTLDANVLGAAYIQGVCNGAFRYQVLSDFSTNNSLMRAMVSHEFGHSFSAVHDAGDGFIMSTPLNNTTQWSAASIQFINNFTQSRFCLSNCYNDPPPVAQFEGSPRSGCAPLSVAFTDQSLNDPTAWSWSFPGASPQASNLQHPEVSYPSRGLFTVSLTASNPFGSNARTEQQYISVEDVPATGFDLVTDGRKVWFTNASQFGQDYFWDFGDGQQSQEANPVHTYTADGTFLVTLVAQNACGQTASQRFLTITTPPQAGFSADSLEGCAPLPVRFTDTSSANTQQRLWLFPGGVPDSSTLTHPEVMYLLPGAYPVTLIVRNPAGTDTLHRTEYIRVRAWPDTVFQFSMDGDTVFVSWPGEADSLRWDFGDGIFSQDSAVTHHYAEEGVYTISLRVWTLCGETHLQRTVSTLRPPIAQWTLSPASGCRPLQVRFEDLSEGAMTERLWFFPGGTPDTSEDPVVEVTYAVPGWYSAGLIIRNPAGADTLWRDSVVQVADSLLADFVHTLDGLTLTAESLTQAADQHFWQFGDGDSATTALVSHTYPAPGTYTLAYRAANVCITDSLTLELHILSTPIGATNADPAPRLWPNPASESVRVAPLWGDVIFQWLDLSGKSLGRGEARAGGLLQINMPPGPCGWYILKLFSGKREWTFRVFRK